MSPKESYANTLDVLRKRQKQLLEELDELQPLIDGLERLAKREASSSPESEPSEPSEPSHDILPPHAPLGPYSQMEFVPAAEDYLMNTGIPQTVQEIAEALVARGFRTRSKDFKNTAQALLKRAYDAGRPLRRIGRSTWAYDDTRTSAVS